MYRLKLLYILGLVCLLGCSSPQEPEKTSEPEPQPKRVGPWDFGTLYDPEGDIFTDTLVGVDHNLPLDSMDIEKEVLPAYEEEFKIEVFSWDETQVAGRWPEGQIRITHYELSTHRVVYTDEKGGEWHDVVDIYRQEFASPEQATREFNRQVKGLNAYHRQPGQGQGNESRRLITGKEIYEVNTGCSMTWFVRDVANRIIWLSQGAKGIAPKTMIRTFCGSGAQLSSSQVIPPEPHQNWLDSTQTEIETGT